MPEEPQNIDQQPIIQPSPQPQPQPQTQPQIQPQSQFQPQPHMQIQDNSVAFNEPSVVESLMNQPTVQPEPISVSPENISPEVPSTVTSEPSGYAPQPQFGVEPQAQTAPQPQVVFGGATSDQTATSPKKSNKKMIVISSIIAGVLVLLGGGGALAYNVVYSAPEKVISDAIVNAISAKNPIYTGKLSLDSESIKGSVEITTKQADAAGSLDAKVDFTVGGKNYTATGNALYDTAGDLYFRVGGIDALVNDYRSMLGSDISAEVDAFVAKVDNKWIKISSKDLALYSDSVATSKNCVNETITKFKGDSSAMTEITELYKKNSFIIIEKDLGTVNGSRGFQINTNNALAKSFADGLKNTKIYAELHECDNMFTIDTTDMATTNVETGKGSVELWVDSWSHQPTKIKVDSNDDAQKIIFTLEPQYNQNPKISTPTDFITLAQLQTEIEKLQKAISDSYASAASSYETDFDSSSI